MEKVIVEKLTYLLDHMDSYIVSIIDDVLHDSNEDPECSAVTTTNLIKCYIDVKKALNQDPGANNVEEYLRNNCLTSDEIFAFEQKRKAEANYYIGKQY